MKKLITPLLLCFCAFNLHAQPQQTLKKASAIERNAVDNTVASVTLPADANYKIGQASELFRDYLELNTNKTQLVLRNSSVSKKGITTERYDEYCNGIKVENGVYTVMYGKDNRANFMNGNFYKTVPISSTPALNEKTAIAKALGAVNARKYAWEMEGLEQQLKIEKKDNNATYYPKGELVWIEDYTAQKSDRKLHLAYKFNVYAMEPLSRHHIYVDAKSGKILHKKSLIDQINGTGTSLYSGPVTFQTSILSGVNKLRDSTRGLGINTFSCANTTGTTVVDVTNASSVWATDASLDAHWGASKVFDYFMLEQGRNSFDDAGAAINSYVHFGVNYNNAFWNGSQMVYGDGSGLPSGFSPLTSLDVCAHEIGHAICQYTADLIYEKESGAMNEGFSDIWAAIIEEYADPHETDAVAKDKWKIGEEIGTNPIRRMDNPNIRYQPDTYGGSYWVNVSGCTPAEANDYCGVHTNSGVLNYWFYLLCNGGSGTNDISNAFAVTGIGTAKGADIAYQTELMLTPTSTYAGCRTASISAATALYGVCSPEVEAVTRAWYAVGVGSNYTTPTLPAITGASSVCQGSNTTFSIATVGGTWSSSNTSVATVGSTTGTISGITSGTARITYNSGACIATKTIIVNPLPNPIPITVPASVCGEGDFVYITTPGPDYSYIVTSHPENIYESSSWSDRLRVYNTTTSTIYATVYYIATNTCGSDTATYPIEIKPVPTSIVGTNIMNVTNTDTLTNSVMGGTWSVNYTDKATINPSTGIINAIAPGLVIVSYTLPAGCYKTFPIAIDDGYPNAVGKINTIIGNGTAGYSPDGTSAESAMVSSPHFVDIDSAGNIYYFDNYYLRKKSTDNIITTIAGTGVPRPFGEELIFTYGGLPATSIPLRGTSAMTVDKYGNVYLAGAGGIEIIDIYGNMTLYAGTVYYNFSYFPGFLVDVPAVGASIGQVFGMTTDKDGNVYYVDYDGGTVNKIDKTTNLINTVAGMGTWSFVYHDYYPYDNVPATTAHIIGPRDVAIGKDGSIYIAETYGGTLMRVDTTGILKVISGVRFAHSSTYGNGGPAILAGSDASIIEVDTNNNIYTSNGYVIRKINNDGIINAFAGTGSTVYNGECKNANVANIYAYNFVADKDGGLILAEGENNRIRKIQNPDLYSPIITGRFTLTTDDTSQLAASLPTGTWSSSNTSVATVDTTGKVISLSIGTTTISYMLADTCRSPIATAVINVTIAPEDTLTLSGITSVCTGTSTTIAASISGGAWTSSNTSIATVNTAGIVTGVAPGTSIISYIVSDSTGTDTATITITIIPSHPDTPTLSGTDVMCALSGYYYSFTASISGGTWSSSNTAVASIASTTGAITALTGGTCTMTYTISNSCGTTIATRNLTVNPTPGGITSSSGTSIVAVGSTITLSCSPAGGVWTISNTKATIDSITGVVTGVSTGSTQVNYTNSFGCTTSIVLSVIAGVDTSSALKIYTIAGTGIGGFSGDDGLAVNAKIYQPNYLTKDAAGNIYFSDYSNRRIRKISTEGIMTTIAGNGTSGSGGDGGPATAAQFIQPGGLAIDASGNIYIADLGSNKIRKVNTSGIITTFAGTGLSSSTGDGGHATLATFRTPMGLAIDNAGNIYVTEQFGHRVRKIATGTNIISTIIGTGEIGYTGNGGPATAAKVSYPNHIFVDSADNIYITDNGNHALRKINTSGIISTIAGNGLEGFSGNGGPATAAMLDYPAGATMDDSGNIFIADFGNHRVRKINTSGIISTYAGTGTPGYNSDCIAPTSARVNDPLDLLMTNDGALLLSDASNNRIRKIHNSNDIPLLITGGTELCIGSTATITSSSSGGSWTSSNTAVATVSAGGLVTGTGVGTATIFYTNVSACGYESGSIIVNVSESIDLATITGTSELCTGSSTTLTSSTTGGSWSSSNTEIATVGSTGTVTGIGTGVVIISYTKTNGCGTAIATKTITVNSTPAAGTITGPIAVYAGNDISLTATPAGGIWSSSNATIATVSSTGTVSGLSMGTVLISYTQGNFCSGDTTTHLVEVFEVLSTNITGALTVCNGASTSLSNATSGGTWSSSNTAIATIDSTSGVATGVAVGTAIISYKVAPGYLAIATLTVNTVPEIATINGGTNLCVGSSSALSSATSGGFWYSTNSSIVTVNSSGLATGVSLGSAVIVYAVSGVCGIGFNSVVMNVSNPTPITGADNVCVSANITLTNSSAGGTWSTSNANASVSTTGIVTGVSAGTVLISYTLPCGTFTKLLTINPLPFAGTISGASTVNAGSTTTFTTTGTSGTWSSSDLAIATVNSTGVVNGIAAGSAVISYAVSNSCGNNIATKSITVLPVLETGITGTLSLCVSSTTTLSNASTGGTWSSGNTSVATINSSGVVTGIAAGTAVISYSLYDSYVTAIVTVNTMPILGTISGGSSVCVGNSTSLTHATAGGTWSSSNETIATVGTTGSVTGVGEGTATITYSVTNACGTSVATRVQTVLPLPEVAVISGASTVCRSTTTTLTSSVSGGTWSSNYTAGASVSTTGVVTGLANGNFIISYRITNSCGTSYASHPISIISAPVSNAITGTATVCESATTTLANVATGGSWSSSNSSVATIAPTTGVVSGVSAGTATISYNITNICGSASASKIVTVNPLPVSGTISGTTTLSAGTSSTLSSSVSGGSWLSANTAVATINSTTGLLNGISGGVTTISYTKTNSCGSAITTVAATITAAITPITGTRVVCVNATTTLANTTTGGTWSIADGTIATVNASTGVVTGVSSGTTTVTYTFSGSGNTTAIITVNPTPAAYTGSGIICTGSQLNLGSIIPGCTWSSSTPARASVVTATGIVTGGATLGTVNISYTNATSCRTITQLTVNGAVANITGLSSPCIGGTFTALNSTTGGTWSSSNTDRATIHPTSGLVTAVGGGTVTLTYSLSTGCYKTATATIGTPPNITGNASACVGATTTLVSSGGTWSSSNTAIATIAGSGVVTGVSLGTANITYRSSSNSACFVTKEVTVNAMPTAISPATVVCPGATATLTSSPSGGVWSSNNSSTASVDATSGVVTGVVNNFSGISIAVIRYTLPTTCSITTFVTVNPLPAPIGGSIRNICIAGTATLTSSTSGATWSSASPSVASITSGGFVTGVSAGLATISYTNSLGCANTAVVTVNAIPGTNTGTATLCIPGGTTTLSNPAGTGTWSSSNSSRASVNLNTGVVTGINTGTANITYTKAAGCISVTQVTVSSCTARPELNDESDNIINNFTVAPNPTTGAINITTDSSGTISIFSIDGKQIVQSEVKQGTNSITLPSDIKTGIYLLRFVGSDGSVKSVRLVYNQ